MCRSELSKPVRGAARRKAVQLERVGVDLRGPQVLVPQGFLDRADAAKLGGLTSLPRRTCIRCKCPFGNSLGSHLYHALWRVLPPHRAAEHPARLECLLPGMLLSRTGSVFRRPQKTLAYFVGCGRNCLTEFILWQEFPSLRCALCCQNRHQN